MVTEARFEPEFRSPIISPLSQRVRGARRGPRPFLHVALTTKSANLSERLGSLQAILPSSSHLYGGRMEEEGRREVRALDRQQRQEPCATKW